MAETETFERALALHQGGRLVEAEAMYRALCASQPENADPRHCLAVLCLQDNRPQDGLQAINEAIRLEPDSPAHRYVSGRLLHGAGLLDQALEAFTLALALQPDGVDILYCRALGLGEAGRAAEAAEDYRRLLALKPDHAAASYNLGNLLAADGRLEEAVVLFQKALVSEPNFGLVYNNLGSALYRLNRLDDALAAYERAAALNPAANVFHNLGVVYQDQARLVEAAACYRKAVEMGQDFAAAHSALLFCLCFDESCPPEALIAEHLRFDQTQIAGKVAVIGALGNDRDPERVIKVGYVSPDYKLHPCAHFVLPLVETHDRAQVQVHCYSTGKDEDDFTGLFRSASDVWRDCHGAPDQDLAELICADEIDILVDCAGHMGGNRLKMFAMKPAPIRVSYPLYPATTGIEAVDYRIVDPIFAPAWSDPWHSEALVRMPDVHVVYRPHRRDILPAPRPPSADGGPVTFGCFNNFAKISEATVAVWARILQAVPGSRLALKWKGLDGSGADDYAARRFAAHGVDPGRLDLSGWSPDPYSPYHRVDIALDPLFANGGTTTCDALWMGVPVVSCHGRTPFSRVGLCHLTNVGLPELAAGDVEAYVAAAVGLALDPAALARVRTGLRERFAASPLMDARRYVAFLDQAYRIMWRRWTAGESASPIAFHAAGLPEA